MFEDLCDFFSDWQIALSSVVILASVGVCIYGANRNLNDPKFQSAPNHSNGFQQTHACNQVKAKVSEALKDADSASFDPGLYEGFIPSSEHPGHYLVKSWVRAQNSFGAFAKTEFIAEVDKSGEVIEWGFLE